MSVLEYELHQVQVNRTMNRSSLSPNNEDSDYLAAVLARQALRIIFSPDSSLILETLGAEEHGNS